MGNEVLGVDVNPKTCKMSLPPRTLGSAGKQGRAKLVLDPVALVPAKSKETRTDTPRAGLPQEAGDVGRHHLPSPLRARTTWLAGLLEGYGR